MKKQKTVKEIMYKAGINSEKEVLFGTMKIVINPLYNWVDYHIYIVVDNQWKKMKTISESGLKQLSKDLLKIHNIFK